MTQLAPASRPRPLAWLDHPAAPAIASALAALILYAITLGGTFIYDDRYIITVDPRISHPRLWGLFWTQGYFANAIDHLYRPLVSMSYALQWQLWGDHPMPYHAANWLLHAAVAASVAEFARRCASHATAFAAGLLFAVHPVHVEAVAQVVGRAELACALGVLGALVLLAKRPLTAGRAIAIFACQVLAILSKEQGVLLPAILLLFVLLLRPRLAESERQPLRYLVILLTWGLAAYMIVREHFLRFEWDRSFLDWGMQPMVLSHGLDRALMPIVLLGHYARLMLFPSTLSIDYGANVIGSVVSHSDPYLWLGFATALLWIICTAAAAIRRHRFALFCLLSLALVYGIVGNIITLIGVNLAERLMYLPSAFFLILIGMHLARLPRRLFVVILAILVSAGAARSFTYARQWNDRLGLYTAALAQQPQSSQIHLLIVEEYLERGDLTAAQRAAELTTAAFPNYGPAWIERARVERARGDLRAAHRSLGQAFILSPSPQIGMMQSDVDQELAAKHPATKPTPPRLTPAAEPASAGRSNRNPSPIHLNSPAPQK